ncbi:MAG: hypothetical protein WBM04_14725 [Candidatus Korobacteraceae bacterium]
MTSNSTAITSSLRSQIDHELVLLETLKELLTIAMRSLSGGEAGSLMETSRQISLTANNLMSLANQVGNLPSTPEEQQRRDKLLAELSQQRSFCRSMLRRWRRSLLLQRQLLVLQSEPDTYSESIEEQLVAL